MTISLPGLPRELLLHICLFLAPGDLAQLVSVSRDLSLVAERMLWDEIELHTLSYHESSYELHDPQPAVPPMARRYHLGTECVLQKKAARLFRMLDHMAKADLMRTKQLLSRVRTLCTVLDGMSCFEGMSYLPKVPERLEFTWGVFALFGNLERLELHGQWEPYEDGWAQSFDKSAPPLPALRFVKLFGYLPANLVQYVLRSATTLERLELGVLDAPVGSYHFANKRRKGPPPRPPFEDQHDGPDDDEVHSLDGDEFTPRPLPIFLEGNIPEYPRLKHIHLWKPSQCNPDHFAWFRSVGFSKSAEQASLSDWVGLLRAARASLETIVLEHRVAAETVESDDLSEREFIEACSSGPAEDRFMNFIAPVFKEETFPSLRSVYMRGILVSSVSAQRRMWFRHFWQERGVACRFFYGKWCYYDSAPGTMQCGIYEMNQNEEKTDDTDDGNKEILDNPLN